MALIGEDEASEPASREWMTGLDQVARVSAGAFLI